MARSRRNEHAALRRKWRIDGTYERLGRKRLSNIFQDDCADEARPVCWICGRVEPEGRKLDVDHHHAPGKDETPRGLLCRGCNIRLGRESDPVWLRAAADYLERAAA